MNDDADTTPTPPPVDPLDDAARARIRGRVLDGLDRESPSSRRWLVPAGAVAAVALVAGLSAAVAVGGDDGGSPGPATSGGRESTAPSEETPTPTTSATTEPAADPTAGLDQACGPELATRAATRVASTSDAYGAVGFFSDGETWQLCTVHGDIVTVHEPARFDRPPAGGTADLVARYAVSTDTLETSDGSLQTSFTAGGALEGGMTADDVTITYAFPGGDQVPATMVVGSDGVTYWAMDFTPTDGPLTEPGVNQTTLRKISVQIDFPRMGSGQQLDLEWGLDTCAQTNHGC